MQHDNIKNQVEDFDWVDVRDQLRSHDRTSESNMYKRYPKVRKTKQERNTNLESLLHPDLIANDRVKI